MVPPRRAIRLLETSSTAPNPPFSKPKVESTHMTMQARNRMVPAFLIKPQSLSQVCMSTVFADGIWYAGSSMTKGAASPENGFVFFKRMADTSTAATPMKYMRGAI